MPFASKIRTDWRKLVSLLTSSREKGLIPKRKGSESKNSTNEINSRNNNRLNPQLLINIQKRTNMDKRNLQPPCNACEIGRIFWCNAWIIVFILVDFEIFICPSLSTLFDQSMTFRKKYDFCMYRGREMRRYYHKGEK